MEKYDLTWTVQNIDETWIVENASSALELIRWMKDELDRRKEIINIFKNTIEDIL